MSESGKLKKTFIILVLAGFLGGILIELLIGLCMSSGESIFDDKLKLLINLVGSGIYGAVAMGGSIVYHIEKWGLFRVTVTHYILTLVAFLITNSLLGWFSSDILLIVIVAFTVAYLIIWIVEVIIWTRRIRKLNRNLELLNREGKEDGDQ